MKNTMFTLLVFALFMGKNFGNAPISNNVFALFMGKNFGNAPISNNPQLSLRHLPALHFSPADDAPDFWKKKKKKKKKKGLASGEGINFKHGLGPSLFFALETTKDVSGDDAQAYGISYFPSIQLASLGETLSLRLAASPTVGLSGTINSQSGGSLAFLFDVPADVELHFGNRNDEGFGGHLGAGFGFNRIANQGSSSNTAFGPHFTFGLKTFVFGGLYGVRVSFMLNVAKKKEADAYPPKDVIGLSAVKYF